MPESFDVHEVMQVGMKVRNQGLGSLTPVERDFWDRWGVFARRLGTEFTSQIQGMDDFFDRFFDWLETQPPEVADAFREWNVHQIGVFRPFLEERLDREEEGGAR